MSQDLNVIRQQITQMDHRILKLLFERHRLVFGAVRSKEKPINPLEIKLGKICF